MLLMQYSNPQVNMLPWQFPTNHLAFAHPIFLNSNLLGKQSSSVQRSLPRHFVSNQDRTSLGKKSIVDEIPQFVPFQMYRHSSDHIECQPSVIEVEVKKRKAECCSLSQDCRTAPISNSGQYLVFQTPNGNIFLRQELNMNGQIQRKIVPLSFGTQPIQNQQFSCTPPWLVPPRRLKPINVTSSDFGDHLQQSIKKQRC